MPVSRFGVSLDEDILKALDEYVIENNYPNRSQAIRALIERNLVEKKWQCNNIVTGAIVMVYNPDKNELLNKINTIRHQYFDVILSSQYFVLNAGVSLEIIAVKGTANRLTELSDKILGNKGISHGKLVMSKAE